MPACLKERKMNQFDQIASSCGVCWTPAETKDKTSFYVAMKCCSVHIHINGQACSHLSVPDTPLWKKWEERRWK